MFSYLPQVQIKRESAWVWTKPIIHDFFYGKTRQKTAAKNDMIDLKDKLFRPQRTVSSQPPLMGGREMKYEQIGRAHV